jgi:hypothetical protein
MELYARIAQSNYPKIVSIKQPFSCFDFIDNEFPNLVPLRRIMSQARLHDANTMIIEKIDSANDLNEENEDIRMRFKDFKKSQTIRLSFFSKEVASEAAIKDLSNSEFIGYCIIKIDYIPTRGKTSRIYESVIKPSRHSNNFVRGIQSWSCRVLKREFHIKGYLYAQQNNLTNVCAHVAIRTAAAQYHKLGDLSYREMNKIVGIDHINRTVGDGAGLTQEDITKIFEAAGARCFVGAYLEDSQPPVPFQKYLYGSIESGFPAIIVFAPALSNSFHAIPIFGHTFNEDTWVPRAESSYFLVGDKTKYIPSESWLSMFIAHDDNWGSNYCIPRHYLCTKQECNQLGDKIKLCPIEKGGVGLVIGTVPKKIKMSPIRAEVKGVDYLFTILPQCPKIQSPWEARLQDYSRRNMLVLRPIVLNRKQYVNHLKRIKDWEGNLIEENMLRALKKYLQDEFFWLIELSVPELFSANRRKIGEVLIRAEVDPVNDRDFSDFIIARLPEYFVLYMGGEPNKPRYRFIPSGIKSHVVLYS